jgi:hypothetical protein
MAQPTPVGSLCIWLNQPTFHHIQRLGRQAFRRSGNISVRIINMLGFQQSWTEIGRDRLDVRIR